MPVLEAGKYIITHTHPLPLCCPEPAVLGSGERQGWVLSGPRPEAEGSAGGLCRTQGRRGGGQKVRLAEWGPPSGVPKSRGASVGCVTLAELSLLSGS